MEMTTEQKIARIREVQQIIKGQHMAADMMDDATPQDRTDYRERFAALNDAAEALEQRREWIPFTQEYDEDKKAYVLSSDIPEDDTEIFVTDGKNVWQDTFMNDEDGCYLDNSNGQIVDVVTHWLPLPKPPKK